MRGCWEKRGSQRRQVRTVARWLERASHAADQFNEKYLRGYEIKELQADELYTFVRGKNNSTWLFAMIEDGQVMKTRRNNRVIQVERRAKLGTPKHLKQLLVESEDSKTLNTSFIERHNLTIRQGSAYLRRRSPCHAREARTLEEHIALLQCHYNFIRPHRGLTFGSTCKTPAMQAGLCKKALTFRDVFRFVAIFFAIALWQFANLLAHRDTNSQ